MSRGRWSFTALAACGLMLAGASAIVAWRGSTASSPVAAYSVTVGVALVWGVGLLLWRRASTRRVAHLLFALAVAYFIRGLAMSDNDWVYSISRALGQLTEFLLVWVMLAFPSGRLRSRHDRVIVAAGAFVATAMWIPTVLFSPNLPLAGPVVACGDSCPTNMLLISNNVALATLFQSMFRWAGALVLIATAVSLLVRLVRSSALTRRTLAPVLVVSILRTLAVAAFVGSGGSVLSGESLVVLFWCVPLSMALGLLLGRLYSAAALKRLVSGLQRRPDAEALRAVMADALNDPQLDINYWVPESERWVDSHGHLTEEMPSAGAARAVTLVNQTDGIPVAEIVHDEALLDQPDLIEAAIASTRLALETNRIQAELYLSDARAHDAHRQAQRRIERDLHDGAQQRLIALRMKVSVLNRILDQDVRRAAELAAELGPDLEAALAEVRDVAHGRSHQTLADAGLGIALAQLGSRSPIPVTVTTSGLQRYPDPVENAVYLACSEAIQNACKHAGSGATVAVDLADDVAGLTFSVTDNGTWAGPDGTSPPGFGMSSLRERVETLGGQLTVSAVPGGGMAVRARITLD